MFGKIDAKKISVTNPKVTFEYIVTDEKQAQLAAGKKALHSGSYSDWKIENMGKHVKITLSTLGPISIEAVVKKLEKMVS